MAKKHLTFLRFLPEVEGEKEGKKKTADNLSVFSSSCSAVSNSRKKRKKKSCLTDSDLTHCTFKGLYSPVAFGQLGRTGIQKSLRWLRPLLSERQVAKYIHVKSYLFDSLFYLVLVALSKKKRRRVESVQQLLPAVFGMLSVGSWPARCFLMLWEADAENHRTKPSASGLFAFAVKK